MPVITFEKTSMVDPLKSMGGTYFADAVKATIHINDKSTLVYEFIMPREREAEASFMRRVPPEIRLNWLEHLKSWLSGQEYTEGTPLDQMAWLSPAQVANLKNAGIASVEALENASDGQLGSMGMSGTVLRAQAKAWTEERAGKALADVGRIAQENEELRSLLAEQQAAIDELRKAAGKDKAAKARKSGDSGESEA